MKTDKLLKLIQQKKAMRSGGALPLPKAQNGRSYYDPFTDEIHLAQGNATDDAVKEHELYHRYQNMVKDSFRVPEYYPGPLKKPVIPINIETNPQVADYYNRKGVEIEMFGNDFLNQQPSFMFAPRDLIYDRVIDPQMYDPMLLPAYFEGDYPYPYTIEAEAQLYENAVRDGLPKHARLPNEVRYKKGGLPKHQRVGPVAPSNNIEVDPITGVPKPHLNPAMVQATLKSANENVYNTLGQLVSTPQSREKARREKIIAKDPSKYNANPFRGTPDYQLGIKEPGADNSVLSDPIAMAAALTAGGVGLGAYGLSQVPRMFLSNLASEATAGLSDIGKGLSKKLFKKVPAAENVIFNNAEPIIPLTSKPWQMKELPGLHLKSTMSDGPIAKIVEPKTGLINVDQAFAIIGKESGGADKVTLIKQTLGENIPKKMDYNEFRKVVQDQLIPLERQFSTKNSNYGLGRIGYGKTKPGTWDLENPNEILENQTLILGNKNKFGIGSAAHDNPAETLGHIHFLRNAETPDVLTVTQIQSDAFQGTHRAIPKSKEAAEFSYRKGLEHQENLKNIYKNARPKMESGLDLDGNPYWYELSDGTVIHKDAYFEGIHGQQKLNDLQKAEIENFFQKSLLDKNHQERYLQELVDYAGKRGDINKIRVPTSETAAKVQGYNKIPTERPQNFEGYWDVNTSGNYSSEHQTILKKYSEQPKTIKKLFGVEPKVVTDSKGNTWYEFDIPKKFKEGTAEIKAFALGGIITGGIGVGALQQSKQKKNGGLTKAQVGKEKDENLEKLISEYKTIQAQINEGYDYPYVKKLKEVSDKLVNEEFTLEKTDLVSEDVKNNPTTTGYCIGTACYLANQAGDPFKYFSNDEAQKAAMNPESTRYLEQSERYIEPGDIIQYKRHDSEKSGPFHAYTVLDISEPDANGFKPVKVVGSPGYGPVQYRYYYLGPDNKIYKDPDGSPMATQLLKRKDKGSNAYNDIISQRNELKKAIEAIEPDYFNPKKTIRYNDFIPTEFLFDKSSWYGGNPENYMYDNPDNKNTYTLGPHSENRFAEQIYPKEAKLPEILSKISDPVYKKKFMQQYDINSKEYDAIAKNMLGIYGAESKFGTDYWGTGKLPEPQGLSKILGIGSVGPFQINRKSLSKDLRKKYSNEDLHDPIKSSEATMEFLAEGLTGKGMNLRSRAKKEKDSRMYMQNVNPENYLEYLSYLHNQPGWLTGDINTKEKFNDVVAGEHPYKKLVDYYSNLFQEIPYNTGPIEVTGEKPGYEWKQKGGKTQKVKIRKP